MKAITYFKLLGLTLCLLGTQFLFAQVDSLAQKLLTASREEKIELYEKLANIYAKTDMDKAIDYAQEGLALVKDENNKHTGFFYLRLGYFYNSKSEHKKALSYYHKALEVSKIMGYEVGMGKCYQNIGVVHIRMGEYEKALAYYLKTLKIYEKHEEENLLVAISNNLGTLYSCRLHDDENAIIHYEKALKISEESGNQEFRIHVLINISEMYMRQERMSQAKETLEAALQLGEQTENLKLVVVTLQNLSQIEIEEKNYTKALGYAQRALKIHVETGYTAESILSYLSLGEIYEGLGNERQASLSYHKALEVAQEAQALPQLMLVYQNLHEYANRRKKYQKGYEYILKYNTLKDSLFNKEKDKQLKEVQAKYDLEKKEKAVQLLTTENKLQEAENANQRTTQMILTVGLIALFVVVVSIAYAYKNKQKSNQVLAQKNLQISQALNDREVLLKEVHHRVKNNLQIVSSLLRLQHKFGEDKKPSEILQEIQDKIQAMAIIHERLYKSSDLSLINLNAYLDNLLSYFDTSYNLPEQNITIHTEVENIELGMDYLVPCGLILNEIIANSIKYAFPSHDSGAIRIEASQKDDVCTLTVQDTGVGLPEGFKIENSSSLGMQLIQGLTRQIKGKLNVISNPGVHYTITFGIN